MYSLIVSTIWLTKKKFKRHKVLRHWVSSNCTKQNRYIRFQVQVKNCTNSKCAVLSHTHYLHLYYYTNKPKLDVMNLPATQIQQSHANKNRKQRQQQQQQQHNMINSAT